MSTNQPWASAQMSSSLLLCEALGFSPQLLLDDIINISNNAVQDGVNGMEEFLQTWADERGSRDGPSQISTEGTIHEVEQGLVAFQTLLEYHTDIAFDFFEAWCLRNVFMIPSDLPIVLPHQAGLDLTMSPEQEQDAILEVEDLRKKLDNARNLNRILRRGIKTANRQLSVAKTRLSRLESLRVALEVQEELPPKFVEMYRTVSSLPPLDILPTVDPTEPGKRQWETNKTGYINWALRQLLVKSKVGESDGQTSIDKLDAGAAEIGTSDELQQAVQSLDPEVAQRTS